MVSQLDIFLWNSLRAFLCVLAIETVSPTLIPICESFDVYISLQIFYVDSFMKILKQY